MKEIVVNLTKEQIISELDNLISEGNRLIDRKSQDDKADGGSAIRWYTKILQVVRSFSSDDNEYINLLSKAKDGVITYNVIAVCVGLLNDIKDYINKGFISIKAANSVDVDLVLDRILSRFHRVAKQLRSRHGGRNTLNIVDEYDVQDLLHALLRLYFDDIRPEEWAPSYAGSCSRMDFLLKNEKIVIEVKKTRDSLKAKELGEQLIVDIERYKVHPDCNKLLCFVYDPEGLLGNPTGIVNDLNTRHEGFVQVIVKPE